VINYNGDPHRVRQHSYSAGDSVPTKQSGWRNHLRPDLDTIERVLKAETASLTSKKRLAEQRTLRAKLDFSAVRKLFDPLAVPKGYDGLN
jgi:hypothetical protein